MTVKGVPSMSRLLFDSGSNSTFISSAAAKRLKARRGRQVIEDITTMGGNESEVDTYVYENDLFTSSLDVITIEAYCMD